MRQKTNYYVILHSKCGDSYYITKNWSKKRVKKYIENTRDWPYYSITILTEKEYNKIYNNNLDNIYIL